MYQTVSHIHDRRQGTLVIELKKRFNEATAIPLVLSGIVGFVFMLFVPPLLLAALVTVGCYAFYFYKSRLILYYDAGTLRVVRHCDFGFWQWRKQTLYNRADVPQPVFWVQVVRSDKKASFHLEGHKVRQYQTRFSFAKEKNLGVICVHKAEWEMRQLNREIDDFFAETPYDKSLFVQSETAFTPPVAARKLNEKQQKKQPRNENREEKRRSSRFDETKRYAFDRGETRIRRGDESFDKGESKPKRVRSKQTYRKNYKLRHHSMVEVDEQISVDLKSGTLKLVSTTRSHFSRFMAIVSIFCYRLLFWSIVLGGPALVYLHCVHGPEVNQYVVPKLEALISTHIPAENREPFENALREYIDTNNRGDENLNVACLIFFGWCLLFPVFIVFSRLLRWPFWGQWTVKMHHTEMRSYEILFSWRNDRAKRKEPSKGFVIFFRIVPAMPKTNRLLTGRPFRDGNSGWRQPYQVVLITDEGSFPLPCGSVDEQEQIVKRIRRFADGVLPKN